MNETSCYIIPMPYEIPRLPISYKKFKEIRLHILLLKSSLKIISPIRAKEARCDIVAPSSIVVTHQ